MCAARDDVLVVGAGPSGLVAALDLVRHGAGVRVVDRKSGPTPQSRASLVHARTLEIFDRLGVAAEALHRGQPLNHVEVHDRGRAGPSFPLAERGVEGRTRFPCALSLDQSETERLLIEALAGHGVQVEWDTPVRHVLRTRPFVEVVVGHGDDGGTETVAAKYLLAADGAASTVRRALDIEFAGTTYPQTGLLADVLLDVDLPPDHLRLSLGRGGFLGIQPRRGERYRLFGAVTEEFVRPAEGTGISHEAYSDLSDDVLQEWFAEQSGINAPILDVEWAALFRVHSRRAAAFRRGNVFLLGDAAHIHSPAGGQGMNLGIGDAANLAWKLAAACRSTSVARGGLLSTYQSEREPIVDTVTRNTDRGFRIECSMNPVALWARRHLAIRVVRILVRLAIVPRGAFRLLSQTWISYRRRPAVAVGSPRGRLRTGDRAPNAALADGGHLLDTLRVPGFHLFVFEGPTHRPADVARLSAPTRQDGSLSTHVVPWTETDAHRAYGVSRPCAVLVRPDGHVAGWCRSTRERDLAQAALNLGREVTDEVGNPWTPPA